MVSPARNDGIKRASTERGGRRLRLNAAASASVSHLAKQASSRCSSVSSTIRGDLHADRVRGSLLGR